jgi:D-glycero-D-manno-heptose 1,7-bisphosphate phosphatase
VTGSRRAVFLDRDGTLNIERDQVRTPADLELIPGAIDALNALSAAGYALVVVTNQSARARGLISEEELDAVHASLRATLKASAVELTDILHCPHHPTAGEPPLRTVCDCRKPEPGLLTEAAEKHGLDLSRSWLIGDAARDIEAGRRAGVQTLLVETGKGASERSAFDPAMVVADIKAAAERIIAQD